MEKENIEERKKELLKLPEILLHGTSEEKKVALMTRFSEVLVNADINNNQIIVLHALIEMKKLSDEHLSSSKSRNPSDN